MTQTIGEAWEELFAKVSEAGVSVLRQLPAPLLEAAGLVRKGTPAQLPLAAGQLTRLREDFATALGLWIEPKDGPRASAPLRGHLWRWPGPWLRGSRERPALRERLPVSADVYRRLAVLPPVRGRAV